MATNSNSSSISSLEAYNGSADSRNNYHQIQFNTTSARFPIGIPHNGSLASNHSAVNGTANGIVGGRSVDEHGYFSSASNSRNTTTYDPSPTTTYSAGSEYGNQLYVDVAYYPSDTYAYPQETSYASEISVEDVPNEAWITERSGYPNDSYAADAVASSSCYYQQTEQSTTLHHERITMRRWSRDNAPDERIRIGLPRWESEQHRAEYQQGNVQEQDNSHDQSSENAQGRSRLSERPLNRRDHEHRHRQ